jgi:hypothetical protein
LFFLYLTVPFKIIARENRAMVVVWRERREEYRHNYTVKTAWRQYHEDKRKNERRQQKGREHEERQWREGTMNGDNRREGKN